MSKTIKNGNAEKRDVIGRPLLAHDRLHDVAISFVRGKAGVSRSELRQAFNDYCKALGADNDRHKGSAISWKAIAAGRIVIDCLHAMNHEQAKVLERELKCIATDEEGRLS